MDPFRRPELYAAIVGRLLPWLGQGSCWSAGLCFSTNRFGFTATGWGLRATGLRTRTTGLWLSARGLARLLALVVAGSLLGWARAQGPVDGAVHGQVTGPEQGSAAGVTLAVRSVETGVVRRLRAEADGSFLLAHLAPGAYSVAVEAPGLASAGASTVQVTLGETAEVRAELRLVAAASSVTVAAKDSLSRLSPALEATISDAQLQLLPSNARRWQDFALTVAGVEPDQDADGLVSVHGLASTQNSVLLDGASQNQSFGSVPAGAGSDPAPDPAEDSDSADLDTGPAQGLSRGRHAGIAYSFSQAAVREFRVTTQNYTALTGGAAGGVITTVSRSGTSTLHGSGFLVLRSQAFAATNPLSIATSYAGGVATSVLVKPHDLRENFGGTVGGPVAPARLRGRPLFYFLAYDQQRRGYPAISSPANPAFYTLTATQVGLLGTRGVNSQKTAGALSYLASLTGATPRRADQEIAFGRVDWQAGSRQSVGLQYNRARWDSPAGLTSAPVVARGRASLGNSAGSLDSVLARATTTLSAHWINQIHLQYAQDLQYERPQANLPQEPAIGPGGQAPEVNIGPEGLLFGTPASLSQLAYPDERRIEVGDTITLERGRHLVQVGASVSAVHDRVATLGNAAGTFRYDSTRTSANAGGLVDFITDYTFDVNAYPNGGCPSIYAATHLFCFTSFTQSFGEQQLGFSTTEWAGFVEDTWRLGRRLTVNAGLRYEYESLPAPQAANPALDAVFGASGATSVFPADHNNLGPRIGIAFEPFGAGKGLVRMGYGAYFGRLPGATLRSALADTALPASANTAGSTTHVRVVPSVETACPQAEAQGFGYPCSFLAQPSGVVAATTSAMVFARSFQLPVVQQGSVSVEHELGRNANLSATYVLNLDRQLASSTDLNIAPSSGMAVFQLQGGAGVPGITPGETFVVPVYRTRVSPAFGPVTEIVSDVNATYNGLVIAAAVQGLHGLEARVSYSWSKAIDFGANVSATPRTDGQFDPFADGYDKGLSSLNYPQALHLSAAWTPRARTELGWARRALDGWELAPIVLARSGRPYSYDIYGGTRLAGGHESINGSGGALYLPTIGRNTLRLPASVNTDLRVGRAFTPGSRLRAGRLAGEPLTVRLTAEVFNLTNRLNVSSVQERAFLVGTASGGVTPLVFQDAAAIAAEGLNTRAFGTPTAANSSLARERQLQFSLRVEF